MQHTRYRIVVDGELESRYAPLFEGMQLDARDGRTEIAGIVRDQSHLQGLLARIAGHGLVLLSVSSELDEDAPNGAP